MTREVGRVAIIGAGGLDARYLFKRLVGMGVNKTNILSFGVKPGSWELSVEDEKAQIFLPLEERYLNQAETVFVFDVEKDALSLIHDWTKTSGAGVFDFRVQVEDGAPLIDPTVDGFSFKAPAFPLVFPAPEALYLANILGRISDGDLGAVDCTIYQPASVRGERGVGELFHQSTQLLNFKEAKTEVLGRQSAFALSPFETPALSASLPRQVETLLGRTLPITCTFVMAPLFHTVSVSAFLSVGDAAASEDAIASALNGKELIRRVGSEDWPPPSQLADERIPVLFSKTMSKNKLWLWIQFDDLACGRGALAAKVYKALITQKSVSSRKSGSVSNSPA